MIHEKKRSVVAAYLIISALLILTAFALWKIYDGFVPAGIDGNDVSEPITLVLDAGHGGYDGGAVSVTGTPEKEINLKMTKQLAALMKAQGYNIVLTRDTDTELAVEGSTQSRKMQDIIGRLNVSKQNPDSAFISIHMNKFPKSRYSGLQVYYADTEGSREIAENVQSSVKRLLQPDNTREVKKTTSSIYLLSHIKSPAILIECGFLSNESEAAMLETDEYRRALALSIYSGLSSAVR